MVFEAFVAELVQTYGLYGLFAVSVIGTSVLPIPVEIAVLIMKGFGFAAFTIGMIAGIGSGIGSFINYGIGYWGRRTFIKKTKSGWFKKAKNLFEKYGFWGIVIAAFTPFPYDIVTILAGVVKYNPLKFFTASLIGRVPRFLLVAYLGEAVINILVWGL